MSRLTLAAGSLVLSLLVAAAPAQDAAKAGNAPGDTRPQLKPDPPVAGEPFVRRTLKKEGDLVSLEVCSRTYRKGDSGPEVSLVGVAHIGEAAFYKALQAHLDSHALVLYESVLPAGAEAPGGATAEERVRSTRESMLFLRDLVERTRLSAKGTAPGNLEAVFTSIHERDSRLEPWARRAAVDAWGHPLRYTPDGATFTLESLGSDNQPGGEGEAADLRLHERRHSPLRESGDGLQSQLASLLGLEFQLEAINYHRPTWVVADMSMSRVARELKERGSDFGPLEDSLAGSGLSGQMATALISIIKVADSLSGGAVTSLVKVLMIEMLAGVGADGSALSEMAPELTEVILTRRNDVLMETLDAQLAKPDCPKSIAVFYGAAHMADLESRLVAKGWKPIRETWFTAITMDLKKAGIKKEELDAMRQQIRSMLGGAGRVSRHHRPPAAKAEE